MGANPDNGSLVRALRAAALLVPSICANPPLQVLNAKPMQTLSMLEEAAGTRMYEQKKDDARRTISKKQVKVEEINKVRRQPELT